MFRAGKVIGVFLGGVIGATAAAAPPMQLGFPTPSQAMPGPNPPAMMPMGPTAPGMAGPTRVSLADVVDPQYRDAVLAVVRKPNISTRGASDDVVCDPALYGWLLDHPDRVSLAWNRLKVPCVQITDLGEGRFGWTDPDGSEVAWRTVGRFPDGVVWYATGKIKPSAVAPVVPVRVVVILTHPRRSVGNAVALSPVVQGYVQTDSRTANAMMKVLGPTAPKLAEQAADQLLFFFNGVARYTTAHPDKAETLLAPPKQ